MIIQFGFDPATTGETARLWVGESGILVNLVLFLAALISRDRLQHGRQFNQPSLSQENRS